MFLEKPVVIKFLRRLQGNIARYRLVNSTIFISRDHTTIWERGQLFFRFTPGKQLEKHFRV